MIHPLSNMSVLCSGDMMEVLVQMIQVITCRPIDQTIFRLDSIKGNSSYNRSLLCNSPDYTVLCPMKSSMQLYYIITCTHESYCNN